MSAGKINFSETLPRSRQKFERTSTRSKLAKNFKILCLNILNFWRIKLIPVVVMQCPPVGSLPYCFRTKRIQWQKINDGLYRFRSLIICGRWNAFFFFQWIIFFFWRSRRKLFLPTVIKTKDKISSDIWFSCLSHTIRINRQYLASILNITTELRLTVEK